MYIRRPIKDDCMHAYTSRARACMHAHLCACRVHQMQSICAKVYLICFLVGRAMYLIVTGVCGKKIDPQEGATSQWLPSCCLACSSFRALTDSPSKPFCCYRHICMHFDILRNGLPRMQDFEALKDFSSKQFGFEIAVRTPTVSLHAPVTMHYV